MEKSQFSLSWNEHVKNICNGLSSLQQNGEFVDMTLAADGHLVKVHQVIMALSSPYIKNLMSSAQCQHPVIFLNKVSFKTLSAILEYIYTGEVLVAVEDLHELIDAAKELHIKGLQDMNLVQAMSTDRNKVPVSICTPSENMEQDDNISYFEIPTQPDEIVQHGFERDNSNIIISDSCTIQSIDPLYEDVKIEIKDCNVSEAVPKARNTILLNSNKADTQKMSALQYTVSNQGSLQMILNRFMYYLKYTNRDKSRQWRCVDYVNNHKCPAYVFTKDDVVTHRISAHNHPFHDKRILKKVKAGAIFSALNDAETEGNNVKKRLGEEQVDE